MSCLRSAVKTNQHRSFSSVLTSSMSAVPPNVGSAAPRRTRTEQGLDGGQTQRSSITGLNIRNRVSKALEMASASLTPADNDSDDRPSRSISSSPEASTSTISPISSSAASRLSRQLRPGSTGSTSPETFTSLDSQQQVPALLMPRAYKRRSVLTDLKNRPRQASYSSSISAEDRELQYRKYNLAPLPPAGYVRPILLPTYAVQTPEDEIHIRIDGFVEVWPKSVGTSQRVFNQMVRQLANLPRLPRQQPSPASMLSEGGSVSAGHSTPWKTSTSASMPSSPLHEDTDDAVFFPDVPYGVPRSAKTDQMREHDGVHEEGFTERMTQQAFSLGAPEKAIGKVLQSVGALPVEGKIDSERYAKEAAEREEREMREEDRLRSSPELSEPGRDGPLGGASVWANRSRDEVERLWHTLEHRLRSFWTYRKPHQQVLIEVIPVFRGEQTQEDQDWGLDEFEKEGGPSSRDASNIAPLIAMTKLTSDANGLFSSELTLSKTKINHYLSHYHAQNPKKYEDLMYLRMRACMLLEGGNDMARSQWQPLRIAPDQSSSIRIICDIDDTAKHTEVLAGSRVVTRNVFVRPFEEVRIAGVTHWFDRLCHEAKIDGFHFVTNAPAEMYSIVKAYLSTAQLPNGHLALKHYFSPTKTASWLQAYLQPAASRKRQNLQRCLDDFPLSRFIFIGDSGEMDLEIYTELAKERPQQVKGIWIRDVGNVTQAAKSMVNGTFAVTNPSSLQMPPAAHVAGSSSTDALSPPTRKNTGMSVRSTASKTSQAMRKGSLNVNTAPTDEYEARLSRALDQLPATTRFRFWTTGQDAMNESVEYIKELKASPNNHVS